MSTYGLSTEGFLAKTLDIIRDEMSATLQQAFGPSIRTDDESILGQLVGIVAERLTAVWEMAEVVYSSQDPDAATGAALEQICLLTGTTRPSATYSVAAVVLTGTPTTVVAAGSKVRTASTDYEFQTTESATIVSTDITTWAISTAYVVGDRVTINDGVFQCSVAGTSASSGTGPTGVLGPTYTVTDGTVTWRFLGDGTGAVDAEVVAILTGPIVGGEFDIIEIVNPVSGWEGVVNIDAATPGRNIATDAELRILRMQELATGGSSTANALRAELIGVPDVESVTIFVNNTDATVDSMPPHSIEALVRGPVTPTTEFDQSIWDALLDGVAAGIQTYGTVVGTATDDEGTEHTMKFTRPTEIPIYVTITIIKDPDEYPDDGDTQIKNEIVEWGSIQNTGKNAVSARIAACAFEVPGVLDVVTCYIDDAPAPVTETTVDIALRQLATYTVGNITVVSSDGVP